MATLYNPKIVGNDLALLLDAANIKSYPNTGSVWVDLSGNTYNGSLVNTPTFEPDNGGSFLFNGTNSYVTNNGLQNVGSLMGNGFTVEYWIKTTTTDTIRAVVGVVNNDVGMNFGIHLNEGAVDTGVVGLTSWYLRQSTGGTPTRGTISAPIYDGAWHHMVWSCPSTVNITNVIAYVDGIRYGFSNTTINTLTSFVNFNQPITIGARNLRGTIERFANMNLACFRWYTRALTELEITQNFNATRSRFGV